MSLPLAASGPLSDTIMPILIGPFWAAVGDGAPATATATRTRSTRASALRMRKSPLLEVRRRVPGGSPLRGRRLLGDPLHVLAEQVASALERGRHRPDLADVLGVIAIPLGERWPGIGVRLA